MRTTRMRRARRLVLASVLAMGISAGVAGPATAAQKGEDFPGGERTFREECEASGGEFYRDRESGAIRCWYEDGTIIMCDKGAKNCTTHRPLKFVRSSYSTSTFAVVAR